MSKNEGLFDQINRAHTALDIHAGDLAKKARSLRDIGMYDLADFLTSVADHIVYDNGIIKDNHALIVKNQLAAARTGQAQVLKDMINKD